MKTRIVLGAILLLGLALRAYNLDFPSIGYHNMNENEVLSIAQEMERTGDFVNKRVYFYSPFDKSPFINTQTALPLVSYQTLLAWKMFDSNLWGPRFFNCLFGAASCIVIFGIAQVVFGNVYAALFCAFLLAIMPLAVFFSRNLQPESPALFFMLLGNLSYLAYVKTRRNRHLIAGGLFFAVSFLYRINFIVGVLPFLAIALIQKKRVGFKAILAFIFPYLLLAAIVYWFQRSGLSGIQEFKGIRVGEAFLPSYWSSHGKTIWWYAQGENFTVVFLIMAIAGAVLAFLKADDLCGRYIICWVVAAVCYAAAFPRHLYEQNYSQMPFLVLVCISCVYSVIYISGTVKQLIRKDIFIYLIIGLILISSPFVKDSIYRLYSTIFPGQDVAGATLRELTKRDERIFLLANPQGYGIARYAQRYMGWPEGLEDFKKKEAKFQIRYICFYPVEYFQLLVANSPEMLSYIQEHYHLKEVGYLEGPNQLYYVILEKGKGEDLKEALKSISGQAQLRTIYKLFDRYMYFYSIRPTDKKG